MSSERRPRFVDPKSVLKKKHYFFPRFTAYSTQSIMFQHNVPLCEDSRDGSTGSDLAIDCNKDGIDSFLLFSLATMQWRPSPFPRSTRCERLTDTQRDSRILR